MTPEQFEEFMTALEQIAYGNGFAQNSLMERQAQALELAAQQQNEFFTAAFALLACINLAAVVFVAYTVSRGR